MRRAPFKKNELSFPRNLEKKTHLSFNSTLWKNKRPKIRCMYWMDRLPLDWMEGGVLKKIGAGINDHGLTP